MFALQSMGSDPVNGFPWGQIRPRGGHRGRPQNWCQFIFSEEKMNCSENPPAARGLARTTPWGFARVSLWGFAGVSLGLRRVQPLFLVLGLPARGLPGVRDTIAKFAGSREGQLAAHRWLPVLAKKGPETLGVGSQPSTSRLDRLHGIR
jgi:hypothetical protein